MEQVKENKMGTAPVLGLIASMSVPAMFSMLVQALYNVVDSFFVAQISESALTAVSLVFPVQNLMIAVGVGTAVGVNSLISRRLGEKRREEADSAATHAVLLGIFNWVIFALFGLIFPQCFFKLFNSTPAVTQMGIDYLSIVTVFSFGMFVEINLEKTLQATGNMIFPMIFQLTGALTNIILDPIFIFGLLGAPRLEVAGAAIATVAGQILSMILALIVVLFGRHEVEVKLKGFRFDWATVKNIYAVGFPSVIMQSIGSVMTMGMNAILIAFSETAVALFGVYFKLQSFVFMPVFGLNQGLMPIVGYNFGARKKHRLLAAIKYGCVIALVIMAIGVVLFWTIPGALLGIFNASEQMLEIGIPALRTISLCFLPAALGIVFSTAFQATGHGFYSMLISLLRQLIVLLPAAFLLAKISLAAVWYAFPIAEVFSLAASIILYLRLYRNTLRTLDTRPASEIN